MLTHHHMASVDTGNVEERALIGSYSQSPACVQLHIPHVSQTYQLGAFCPDLNKANRSSVVVV